MAKSSEKSNTSNDLQAALGNLTLKTDPVTKPTHEQIAQRAYERWQRGGCQSGMAELDWRRAEEELTAVGIKATAFSCTDENS